MTTKRNESERERAETAAKIAERIHPDAYRCLCRLWEQPGIAAKDLPMHLRRHLKRMEEEGAAQYNSLNGGWYAR